MADTLAKGALTTFLALLLLSGCQLSNQSAPSAAAAEEPRPSGPAVTVTEDDSNFILANGTVTATVAKATGNLLSLQYKGMEMLFQQEGKRGASFSQNATGGTGVVARVTIDPRSNNGDRAEISVKGTARRDVASDVDLRFSIGRGEPGIYFYLYFDHRPEYPAVSLPESRWVARLDETFDWTPVDDGHMREVAPDLNGHQYLYAASYFEERAYGWASDDKRVGLWLINPSAEYIGGGATNTDFLTHRDNPPSTPFAPCILNFWKSSHFGNGTVPIGEGEHWTKVIGPMFIYCNNGADPMAMWKDAKAKATREARKWPYEWVNGIEYAKRNERGTVKGQLMLADPLMPKAKMSNVLVGLAHAAYTPPFTGGRVGRGRGATTAPGAAARGGRGADAGAAGARQVEWPSDAKYYQFWVHGQDNGEFSIPNVIPGSYTLHAVADGVLGEFAKADITVEADKPLDLGKLTWTPVRKGKQIWEVGIANRSGKEFTNGDKFYDPRGPLLYPKLFPNDVSFVIGKSDPGKDWFYEHVPHATDDSGQLAGNQGVTGNGRATPYKIEFDMPATPKGKAILRLAICGTQARSIDVSINDKPAGQVSLGGADAVITRHGISGVWYEREVAFDAALMKQGRNVLTLTIPAGPVNNGVVYDYLRLELDELTQAALAR
jgi:rhamnogalacturonan endolyase